MVRDQPPKRLQIDFPKFDGEDALYWVDRAKQYFEWKGTQVRDCMQIASFYL